MDQCQCAILWSMAAAVLTIRVRPWTTREIGIGAITPAPFLSTTTSPTHRRVVHASGPRAGRVCLQGRPGHGPRGRQGSRGREPGACRPLLAAAAHDDLAEEA